MRLPLLVQAPPGRASRRSAPDFSAPSTGIAWSEVTAGTGSRCPRRARGCHVPLPTPGQRWALSALTGLSGWWRAVASGESPQSPEGRGTRRACSSCSSCAFPGAGSRAPCGVAPHGSRLCFQAGTRRPRRMASAPAADQPGSPPDALLGSERRLLASLQDVVALPVAGQ